MNRQMTIDAMGSRMGTPSRAPSTPAKLPIDDSASDRWCHASALSDTERMRLAAAIVYQYSPSFTPMDTTAAMSASTPGAASVSPRTIFITPA